MSAEHLKLFEGISPSQWGAIRNLAVEAKGDVEELLKKLSRKGKEEEMVGFLWTGVAAKKYWNKRNGEPREALLQAIEKNKELGTIFVAKLAVEMAKYNQDN